MSTPNIDEDGLLTIDLGELLDPLSRNSEAMLNRIARLACFHEPFVSRLLDHLAEGSTEDGDWWGSGEQIRKRLLPLLPEAMTELVREIGRERDFQRSLAAHYRDVMVRLSEAWNSMDHERKCKLENWEERGRRMTREEAAAFVERAIAEEPKP